LTTAHYYTPSGRLIQRPWDETFDEYLSYTLRDQDPNKVHPASDLKYTVRLGRKVYSGGGIEPDHRLDGPIQGFNPGKFGRRLYPTMFAIFARRYDRDGDTQFGAAADANSRHAITGQFVVGDAAVQEFRNFVKAQMPLMYDEAGFNADIEFIKAMIRFEVDMQLFDVATAWRHVLEKDPQAQYALGLFGEAESMLKSAGASTKAAAR